MKTNPYLKHLTVGSVLLASGLATVCQAQLTSPSFQLIANPASINGGLGANNDPVASWSDSASSGISVTAAGSVQPTFLANQTPNGQGAVRFDAVDDFLSASGVSAGSLFGASASSTFIVLKPNANPAATLFSWFDDNVGANNGVQAAENTPSSTALIYYGHGDLGAGNNVQGDRPANWANGDYHVLSLVRNSDGSGTIRFDGAAIPNLVGSFTGPLNTAGSGTLGVGGSVFGDRWGGDIAELRVYKEGDASLTSIQAVESELTSTYITPVPEPAQYATVFSVVCVLGALVIRRHRQNASVA